MKLKVYQQGGGLIYTPFIPEQYADSSGRSSKSSSGSDSEDAKLDPLDKELLGLMKDQNLLPSDIQAIYNKLVVFQKKTQKLSEMEGFGGTGSYRSVMPGMLQIMNLTNQAKNNKEYWDQAVSEIKKHNAGSEIALDAYGRMWVNSEDGIKKIAPSEFDNEKYSPLSYSQLLYMRRNNPELAFSDSIFGETGMDVIGAADVRKEIDDIIANFGSIKSAEFKKQVFQDIASDLQGEGIFKITSKYSKADLNDFSGLLYSRLSNEAKHLIKANAAVGGYDPIDYIRSIISSQTDVDVDPNYEASLSKANALGGAGGSGSDGDEKNLTEYNYVENLATGRNFELPKYTTFNPVSTVSLHAAIQNTGSLMRKDGITPVGPGMVDSIFETVEGLKQISPQYTVTFGDQILDETAQGALMYDGSALQRIKLPYKEVNGEVTVNWNLVNELEEANKQLQEKGATPGMIQELIANNPELVYNKNTGMIEAVNSMWFLTFGAMMGHDFVQGLDTNSRYLERMSQDKADFWHRKYEEAAQYGFVNHDKNAPKRTDSPTDKGFLGRDWSRTRYYHGNVFIPILNDMAGAVQYYSKNSHMANAQTRAMNEREEEIRRQVDTGQRSFNW